MRFILKYKLDKIMIQVIYIGVKYLQILKIIILQRVLHTVYRYKLTTFYEIFNILLTKIII